MLILCNSKNCDKITTHDATRKLKGKTGMKVTQ